MQDPGDYNQPPQIAPAGEFQTDKIVGIIIMVLSFCAVGVGLLGVLGIGAVAGAMGAAATEAGSDAAGAAALGGAVAMLAVGVLIAMGALGILIGWGIMKSARWAFITGCVVYGLSTLGNLAGGNIIAVLFAGALLAYCILRLTGQVGPKPA